MDKKEALREINITQDYYVDELIKILNQNIKNNSAIKETNFSSPTGTGKTIMMANLINKLNYYFFVVTTLSRGQLKIQIDNNLRKYVQQDNYVVFGLNDYSTRTILQEKDILKKIPKDRLVIWLRDEGHIATNRWYEVIDKVSNQIVNFSATNKNSNGV